MYSKYNIYNNNILSKYECGNINRTTECFLKKKKMKYKLIKDEHTNLCSFSLGYNF